MNRLFIVLTFFISLHASAQAPANDNCASAALLNATASCSLSIGTVSLATQSIPPITCGVGTSAIAKEVWFYFNATAPTATINVSPNTQAGNNFNVVVSLYSACNGSLLACADNLGNLQQESLQASGLTYGAAYYISVYQYKNSTGSADPANPTFSICIIGDDVTGIDVNEREKLFLSPNPVGSFLNLPQMLVPQTHSVMIYDVQGKTVFYTEQISQQLDVSELTPGIYHVMILQKETILPSSENRILHQKIIKQ